MQKKLTTLNDLIITIVFVFVTWLILSKYDAFEKVVEYLHLHEEYELDEILLLLIIMGAASIVFSIRRVKEALELNNSFKKINAKLEEKVTQEIEKQRKQEYLLIEQSKMAAMGEMIGNIAHQWRQPLSVISTGSTGMKIKKQSNLLTDESFFETCDIINDNAQYLSKTIDDFRNFAEGRRDKSVFNLKKALDSFLVLIEGSLKYSEVNVEVDIDESIEINGYKNELLQCLMNIFNNAKDAIEEQDLSDKFIFISIRKDEEDIVINIKDNAGGIPKDILPKIFEPYFTTKHKSQGTGLGLHMTYNLIVDGMNGTIVAQNISYKYNKKDYTGAEFIITLPMI